MEGETYDANVHQLPDNVSAPEHALVAETLVAGYSYQGQTLRRPVVSLKNGEAHEPPPV
jgi:hypothetical protein